MFLTNYCRMAIAFTAISMMLAACSEDRAASTAPVADREIAPTTGPISGALVVAGGNVKDAAIIERFLKLAGGRDVPIVVVPTAAEGDDSEPFAVLSSRSWDDKGDDQSNE